MSKIRLKVNEEPSVIKAHLCNDEKFSQYIRLIFRSLGFSFQKSKGYFPEAKHLLEKIAGIKNCKYRKNNLIVFEDETLLSNTATLSYNWSRIGCHRIKENGRRYLVVFVLPLAIGYTTLQIGKKRKHFFNFYSL